MEFKGHTIATVLVSASVIIASGTPWLRFSPVPTARSYGEYEWALGLHAGFHPLDAIIVVPALAAIGIVLIEGKQRWIPPALVFCGCPISFLGFNRFMEYHSHPYYAVQPGLYVVFIGGILLIGLGVSSHFIRIVSSSR